MHDKVSPAFAATREDLHCLLANAHGVVLERDAEYWKQFSVDVESVPESTGSTGFFARLTGITRAARMELVEVVQ